MNVNAKKLQLALDELKNRKQAVEAAAAANIPVVELPPEPMFTAEQYCFDKQLAFINDPSKFKTAVCSRRAGKSEACAADLISTALKYPRTNLLYITLSRTSAERIIWRLLLNILSDHKIPHKTNNKELILTLQNGSVIYVSGAKDSIEIEKFRGMSIKLCYIDECQSFKNYVSNLVEDVIMPATWDVNGTICLIGTPGPIPAGYFFDQSQSPANSNHKWTLLDNPWIERKSGKPPQQILADERARKGIDETNPTYRREALGEWVQDSDALVFKFDNAKNVYKQKPSDSMTYIMGIDIGYIDADAVAILAYSDQNNQVYLVEELVTKKQDITSLANQIKSLSAQYNPVKMILDAGALGKKIQEEIRIRHGLNTVAAQKERKHEFIELLNDDLRSGRFKAPVGSKFEQDCAVLVWEFNQGVKQISDRTHSDISDAILYAWKECRHYFEKQAAKAAPSRDSNEYMAQLEEREAEALQRQLEGDVEDWGVDDGVLESVFDVYGTDDEQF